MKLVTEKRATGSENIDNERERERRKEGRREREEVFLKQNTHTLRSYT